MTRIPERNLSPRIDADRPSPPPHGSEREVLTTHLDWHRTTFEAKCAGLAAEPLSRRAVPPSTLSLHGLIRHLAGGERWWLRIRFAGEEVPMLHYSDDDPDQDFEDLSGDPVEALARWRAEVERSREITAASSLDDLGADAVHGGPTQLRVILVKLIGEYARHNGHADLLRERIDGATGY
ncbi:DinB family protein [Nocardiopsis sp. N85]|uniref:DinB family protein n=1 Tax=Nocardiopsis sp. N85 TaxID=3029400 RepID=UPI00237F963C|nr:DinB family protein [Nocardiopsis sp. N85]MDE3721519.1 DinB family protein [Nocardiopsis sp. N85]